MPDTWSLITGAASILGLLLALADKCANWRKYLIPVACVTGGFTLGRLSTPLVSTSSTAQTSGLAIVVLVFLGLLAALSILLVKHKEYSYAYIILLMGLIIGTPKLTDALRDKDAVVSPNDVLVLAELKYREGDSLAAETFYRKVGSMAVDADTRQAVLAKADAIRKERLELIRTTQTNSPTRGPTVRATVRP